jgi:hypothetical protein
VATVSKSWLVNVSVFTLTGLASSAVIGFALGETGRWLLPQRFWPPALLACVALALAVSAREFGLIDLPLPQLRRQTPGVLAHLVPAPVATGAWGFDIGLTFTTYLTFPGPWLLLAVAVASADPAFAAALFAAYWAGRALSLWLIPLLLANRRSIVLTPHGLMAAIGRQSELFRTMHACSGLVAATILILLLR